MLLSILQLETWSVDINQYVLEECDDSIEYSVRISAQHVLQEMSRVLGEVGQVAIFKAAQICLQSAVEQQQQHGGVEGRWWKLRESGLLAIGVLIEDTESDSFFCAGASDTPGTRSAPRPCALVFLSHPPDTVSLGILLRARSRPSRGHARPGA